MDELTKSQQIKSLLNIHHGEAAIISMTESAFKSFDYSEIMRFAFVMTFYNPRFKIAWISTSLFDLDKAKNEFKSFPFDSLDASTAFSRKLVIGSSVQLLKLKDQLPKFDLVFCQGNSCHLSSEKDKDSSFAIYALSVEGSQVLEKTLKVSGLAVFQTNKIKLIKGQSFVDFIDTI